MKIVLLRFSLASVCFVSGRAHAGPLAFALPEPQPTPSESPFEVRIGFPVWIPFPEGTVGARLPFVSKGTDRVEAHIRPFKNYRAFVYILPLSIELLKCRWLVQVSGYYLDLSTSVDPRRPC